MQKPIRDPYVIRWLGVCLILIFMMVVLGGVTRLTGSGLSMVKWHPIHGTIPPISDLEWQEEFNHYKQSPEFIKKNSYMDVHDFKGIFYFEYAHRMLGRLIGIVFLIPFLIFLWQKRISTAEIPKYVLMFILGGLQGLLGWYMVKSGLVNNPHVSQYRLTAHLISAITIYIYILWTMLNLMSGQRYVPKIESTIKSIRTWAQTLTVLVLFTIMAGGLVAGLKAGLIYNTFPKMGEHWIPPEIMTLQPFYMNFFENLVTVQFDHRILAITTFVSILIYWFKSRSSSPAQLPKSSFHWLLIAAIVQVCLGISTLLLAVPVALAATHQAGALILITMMIINLHAVSRH